MIAADSVAPYLVSGFAPVIVEELTFTAFTFLTVEKVKHESPLAA